MKDSTFYWLGTNTANFLSGHLTVLTREEQEEIRRALAKVVREYEKLETIIEAIRGIADTFCDPE